MNSLAPESFKLEVGSPRGRPHADPDEARGQPCGHITCSIGVQRDFLVCVYIYRERERERERLITRMMKSQMEKRLENDVEI